MSKVKEFVDIVAELYAELHAKELDVPPEVSAGWASTIFINSNHPSKIGWNKCAAKADTLSATGELKVKGKPKQTASGKTQYSINVDDVWYNSLSLECFKGRKFNVGDTVTVKYTVNGNFKNMTEVLPAESDDLEQGEEVPF